MKTIRNALILSIVLLSTFFFSSCEDPMDKELSHRYSPTDEFTPNPPYNRLPYVQRIIKRDFKDARGWRIIWSGGQYDASDAKKLPAIFSTITGSVNSIQYLNNTSPQNTENADMWIYFSLEATSDISGLGNESHQKKTLFKLSGMNVADLQNAAENDPNLFTIAYEWDLNESNGSLSMSSYNVGDIFTFKTDRSPVKYGAIRIVDKSPLTVEVVVQK